MKGLTPLLLGIFGTFFFSWAGLTMIPSMQIGHLDPQMDEEGTDVYPAPKSGLAERGRQVYAANGCVYCHSQQVRPAYAGTDIERKWGDRRSAPRDYLFERPALLGKMRMGPDLANIGSRAPATDETAPPPSATDGATGAQPPPAPAPAPAVATNAPATAGPPPGAAPAAAQPPGPAGTASVNTPASASPEAPPGAPPPANTAPPDPAAAASPAVAVTAPTADGGVGPATTVVQTEAGNVPLQYSPAWHHQHLYDPRSINIDSTMPSYRFLYEKRRIGAQPSANAVVLEGDAAPPEGWEIVPTYEAEALVAYLISLDQSHALNEVKSPAAPAAAPAAPAAPGKTVQ